VFAVLQGIDRLMRAGPGACELCGHEATKAQMSRHLASCAPQHDVSGTAEPVVQIRVEARGAPEYWLLVEGYSRAALSQLDALLRRVWLECCGHMSAFRIGRQELSMRTPLGQLGGRGATFQYEYDFGSTTALSCRLLGTRAGSLGRRVVRVLSRNKPLDLRCEDCSAPAILVCPYCIYSGPCLYCDKHAPAHECADEDAFLPVVNSPRVGVCGYTG